jgi:hypothetical protein
MAKKNEQTSKKAATAASKVLRNPKSPEDAKTGQSGMI